MIIYYNFLNKKKLNKGFNFLNLESVNVFLTLSLVDLFIYADMNGQKYLKYFSVE